MKVGRILGGLVVLLVAIPVIAAVTTVRMLQPGTVQGQSSRRISASAVACSPHDRVRPPLIGVAPGPPWGRSLSRFVRATGVHPQIVAQYLTFGDHFNAQAACRVSRAGGELLIQWDPMHVSPQQIASGQRDPYIIRFAHQVKAARVPIVLSFGHEMNGNWYPWGYGHASPKTFVAAWRHLHDLFAKVGARNVTWCWDVNHWDPAMAGHAANYGIGPARLWWPGARYVDWIGLDAYYETPGDTFQSLFGGSLRALHQIAPKPVLIAETAAGAGPLQATQIASLFSGLRRGEVIGAVWFDAKGRQTWQIEGQRAAIAAFRAGSRSLHHG